MKPVRLHITTRIEKQRQKLEQTCTGKLGQKGDCWTLLYKEDLGEGQVVPTTVKIYPDKAVVIRTGAVSMRQEFETGKWTEGKYAGPFGVMLMETKTEKVLFREDQFLLQYRLKLNQENMGHCEVSIQIKEQTDAWEAVR